MTPIDAFWAGLWIGALTGSVAGAIGVLLLGVIAFAVLLWLTSSPDRPRERVTTAWWRGGR